MCESIFELTTDQTPHPRVDLRVRRWTPRAELWTLCVDISTEHTSRLLIMPGQLTSSFYCRLACHFGPVSVRTRYTRLTRASVPTGLAHPPHRPRSTPGRYSSMRPPCATPASTHASNTEASACHQRLHGRGQSGQCDGKTRHSGSLHATRRGVPWLWLRTMTTDAKRRRLGGESPSDRRLKPH